MSSSRNSLSSRSPGIWMTLGIVLLLAVLCTPVIADVLFTEDFESGTWNANWANGSYQWLTRVAAPAPGHGDWSLMLNNTNQRLTRSKLPDGTNFSIASGLKLGLRFYFYDQAGAKGNFAAISTAPNTQAFALGNTTGADTYDFELVNPMAWYGTSIWGPTTVNRTFGAWHRCDVYYDGNAAARYYIDGVLANENTAVVKAAEAFAKIVVGIGGLNEAVPASYVDDISLLTDPYFVTIAVDPDYPGGTIEGGVSGLRDSTEMFTLTAVPMTGYHFLEWKDLSINPTETFQASADMSCIARFEIDAGNLPLALNVSPAGAGTTTGAGGFAAASTVTISAAPAHAGYAFSKWSTNAEGTDSVSTSNPYSFTLNAATTLYAIFAPQPFTLSRVANAGGTVSGDSGTKLFGSSCTVVATPDGNKAFAGWSTDAAGTQIVSRLATYTFNMPAQNYTLYANFTDQQKFSFSDGFETRNIGTIDMNSSNDANSSVNGNLAGNPWWGTMPGNGEVETVDGNTTVNGVTTPYSYPHSGGRMLGGWVGNALNYINIAYRANNNAALTGNFVTDWWFFDFWGPNGNFAASQGYCADAISLCNFTAAPITLDYPSLANSRNFVDTDFTQKLSLGCSKDVGTGFDKTKYQARIMGASGLPGQYGSNGWINLPMDRALGWHHARIFVGPKKSNGHNDVTFYIDNMANPLLTADTSAPASYNLLEVVTMVRVPDPANPVNRIPWSHPMVWDDFTFASIPAVVNLIASPADHVNTTVHATWDGIGAARYQAQIDGGAWFDTPNSHYDIDVAGLANGSHTIGVKGIDASSNEGMPTTATFVVDKSRIHTWAVLGHYPWQPTVTTGSTRFSVDFLAPEGSEATLGDATHPWNASYGSAVAAKTGFTYTSVNGIVDFNVVYNTPAPANTEWGVSYLFTYVVNNGPAITDAYFTCGSDDGNKLFVNGYNGPTGAEWGKDLYRGLTVDGDLYGPFTLNPGVNRLLFKITQGSTGYQAMGRICDLNKADGPWQNQLVYTLTPAPPAVASIDELFGKGNGTSWSLSDQVVTMAGNGAFWIGNVDRTKAIKVISNATVSKGHLVDIQGTIDVVGTQRVITASSAIDKGAAPAEIKALGVITKSAGGKSPDANTPSITDGKGVFNVGLYVRVGGNVVSGSANTTDPNNKYFYLDDGSGLVDGANVGIKVLCGTIDPPTSGTVIVTGAIGTIQGASSVVPVLNLDGWRNP